MTDLKNLYSLKLKDKDFIFKYVKKKPKSENNFSFINLSKVLLITNNKKKSSDRG